MRVAEADFETTTVADDCRVWAWAVCFCEDYTRVEFGTDIDSFLLFCAKNKADYYFHNLGFDGRFIVDRLMKLGYKWVADRPGAGEFTTLVSSKNKFYQLEVRFYSGMSVRFRDSLKLFPMSVKRIAKAYDLEEGKGELDYETVREVGHELTAEECDYIRRDVQIVAQALETNLKQGLTKMTIGSNAFGFFKDITGKKRYEHLFPVLTPEVDADIRRSYRGGFTYVSPEWAGKDVYGGISVDYNSMYPSMLISKPYPVGEPILFYGEYEKDDEHPLYVQNLTCTFDLKPDGIPMIQLRNSGFYGQHEYVTNTREPVSITLTCVDLDLLFTNYDVDVLQWEGGYKFGVCDGKQLFGAYVDHWGKIKQTSKGPMRQLAKLMLNNIYGKFATNPDVTQKVPKLAPDGVVRWELGDPETRDPVYIPVGTFCTAWARHTLITAIHENRSRFVYCDTDSMHLQGTEDPAGIRLHDTDFCAWKVEGQFAHARHLRAKCYIWDLNGRIGVTCAGMPDNVKRMCTFDNFKFGLSNINPVTGLACRGAACKFGSICPGLAKLLPKAVPGGVVLIGAPYELKE
jgi:hypothetical protein